MFRIAIATMLALTALPALAQDGPEACAAIGSDAQRLVCYDALFPPTPVSAGGLAPIVIESQQLIPAQPTGRAPATLTFACTDGVLTAAFAFAGQTLSPSADNAPISVQADLGATAVRNLPVTADNRAAIFGSTAEASAFIDSLAGATNLRVRATPQRSRSLTVVFRWADVTAEVAALRDACR